MESQREKTGQVREWLLLSLLIIALTLNAIYWGSQKEGFHLDEMYSYNQICSPIIGRPWNMDNYKNHWHDASVFEDFLVITEEEAFDLPGAWNTAKLNSAHPPLYFVIFELVTSAFFQNCFTKWSGITTNLIFFVLHLIVLYLLSKKIFMNRLPAMASVLIYGISVGAVSTVIYIRMYMILTFFSTLLFYMHSIYLEKMIIEHRTPDKCLPTCFGIGIVLLGGALTQYYFLIFAFFSSLFFMTSLLFLGQRKHAAQYAGISIGAVFLFFAICPSVIRDLLYSERGLEARSNIIGQSDFFLRLQEYLRIIDRELFGSLSKQLFVFAVLILLFLGWQLIIHKRLTVRTEANSPDTVEGDEQQLRRSFFTNTHTSDQHQSAIIFKHCLLFQFALTGVGTLLVIAKIAPYQVDRYIMNLFPVIILIVLAVACEFAACVSKKREMIMYAVIICVFLAVELNGYVKIGVQHLYPGLNDTMRCMEEYSDTKAVYIAGKEWAVSGLNPYLVKSASVYPTDRDGVSTLSAALDEEENYLILFGYNLNTDQERLDSALKDLQETIPKAKLEYLFETAGTSTASVYYLQFERDAVNMKPVEMGDLEA